jgi:hypothetical protein
MDEKFIVEKCCELTCESCRLAETPELKELKRGLAFRSKDKPLWWHEQHTKFGEYRGLIYCDASQIREYFKEKL